jgi:hypothetical protein
VLSAAEFGHACAALGEHRGVGYERRSNPRGWVDRDVNGLQ